MPAPSNGDVFLSRLWCVVSVFVSDIHVGLLNATGIIQLAGLELEHVWIHLHNDRNRINGLI